MKTVIVLAFIVATALAATKTSSWRILGGKDAHQDQFPHQVSLRINGTHGCGGSILDETTILSAAHCVDSASVSSLTVRVGNVKLSLQTEEYNVSSFVWHEHYDPWNIKNDVSIVKLASPIEFGEGVQPIALRRSNVGEEEVILSGWGTTSYAGDTPDDLQFIQLHTIGVEDCQTRQPLAVAETEVCTLAKSGGGACHGDSGSPLIDGKGEQIGIASWVIPCGVGYPDVFTRVYSFLDWIERNRH